MSRWTADQIRQIISSWRERAGQGAKTHLHRKSGVSTVTISHVEQGRRVSSRILDALAHALETIEWNEVRASEYFPESPHGRRAKLSSRQFLDQYQLPLK